MRPPYNPKPLPVPLREEERRRSGRLPMEDVVCSLGEVVDLSVTGMRVFRKGRRVGRVGQVLSVVLKYGHFALPVDARIVRIERTGFLRYVYGLHFEEVNPQIQAKLASLAQVASRKLLISPN